MSDRLSGPSLRPRSRVRVPAGLAAAALLTLVGCSAPFHGGSMASPDSRAARGATTSLPYTPGVESLYAEDMVARINAERAARSSDTVPVPQLQVDAQLQAEAQAWSAHIAAIGTVADPPLPPCDDQANQVCVLAANSGNTGYGYWPGDGSDGMNQAYMNSAAHRQNELGAAYTVVGVGVTCADDQAWTVELFGYTYGDLPSAYARANIQNFLQGDPVPASPVVAGTTTGDPVYCPGQTDGPDGAVTTTGGQHPYPYSVASVPGEPDAGAAGVVSIAATHDSKGYWLARADGTVQTLGDAVNHGSMAGQALTAPITHLVPTPDGRGYWLVAGDGGIFAFGDAGFYGSMGGHPLNAPVVDLAPTADGRGYWLVGSDGGIFAFGDAVFRGSMGGQTLNAPVVGLATDAATGGYWLVASDGGIFAFDAPFFGSAGALALAQPVDGMVPTHAGNGYWLVASDGAVFAYGRAGFRGSTGGLPLAAPVVGMAADGVTGGYWLVASDGGVFAFDAPFYGRG